MRDGEGGDAALDAHGVVGPGRERRGVAGTDRAKDDMRRNPAGTRFAGETLPAIALLHARATELLRAHGVVGRFVEYFGPGVETLSVPQRATVTNMGAELGVTTSVFPSDEKTLQFLTAQGRDALAAELAARLFEALDTPFAAPSCACPAGWTEAPAMRPSNARAATTGSPMGIRKS